MWSTKQLIILLSCDLERWPTLQSNKEFSTHLIIYISLPGFSAGLRKVKHTWWKILCSINNLSFTMIMESVPRYSETLICATISNFCHWCWRLEKAVHHQEDMGKIHISTIVAVSTARVNVTWNKSMSWGVAKLLLCRLHRQCPCSTILPMLQSLWKHWTKVCTAY